MMNHTHSEEEIIDKAVRHLVKDPIGTLFLHWLLLDQCALLSLPYAGGEEAHNAYNMGRYSVGQPIMQVLRELQPTILFNMLKLEERETDDEN